MANYINVDDALAQADFVHGRWDDTYVSSEKLMAIPAADVAPVVHGHWLHLKNGEVRCSVCNALTCVGSDLSEMTKDIFYCYHCGAKMDGGEE